MTLNDTLRLVFENTRQIIYPELDKAFGDVLLVDVASRYSLLNCGKLIRPTLVLETAKLFNVTIDDNLIRLATAIELIHTYSLVHDDLPCMDNDDIRRGKPSNHKVFGDGMATLCGDNLLNKAYEILLGGNFTSNYLRAVRFFALCCGNSGMIGGQSLDIFCPEIDTLSNLEELVTHKTSRLLQASICCSAMYCGASEQQVANLHSYADNLGLAYQLKDDLLDSDKKEAVSFVKILGLDGATEKLDEYISLCNDSIKEFPNNEFFLHFNVFNRNREA